MANSTTKLQEEILLFNQIELVSPTTGAGTLIGIAFTLFCLYVHALVPRLRDKDTKRQAMFMLVYSTAIMLCGAYNLVFNTWLTQDAYIKHSKYPGSPTSYLQTLSFHNPKLMGILYACQLLIDTLTSAIQTKIWRVWVIWNSTRHANLIVVLPVLCFLSWTALEINTIISVTTLILTGNVLRREIQLVTAEVALQTATTILCTVSISLFLVFEQWRQRKLIGRAQGSTGYLKIVAMLVESYAMESIWLVVSAIPADIGIACQFFVETYTNIEIIAYLLVQYRVASGKAYESQRGQSQVSSLHWNHSNHAATQFEATSEAGSEHHMSVKPEASDGILVSSMA